MTEEETMDAPRINPGLRRVFETHPASRAVQQETMDAGALREALERIDREESAAYGKIGTLLSTADHIAVMNALIPMSEAILDAIDLAAAREPVAPAEAEPPGLRETSQAVLTEIGFLRSVIRSGETLSAADDARIFTAHSALRAALVQPPAPVSAAGAWEALRERINEIAEWFGTAKGQRAAREAIDQHRPAIEAAIRGTEASPLGTERLTVTFDHHIPTDSWSYIAGDTDVGAFETFEGALDDFTRTRFMRFAALRGQPSETPAAGDGEAGA